MVGLVACALRGRAAGGSSRRTCGGCEDRAGALREAVDVARTFTSYASCLAEVLGAGSLGAGAMPQAVVRGELHLLDALADGRGCSSSPPRTRPAGRPSAPCSSRDHGLRVMIVEQAERDARASAIQDEARRAHGLLIVHVGDDPALGAPPGPPPARGGGVVALQIDRAPQAAARTRRHALRRAGARSRGPAPPRRRSPARPSCPIFAARTGHRRYVVELQPAVCASRAGPRDAELDAAAQALAGAIESFVRARPTQWFHFRDG